MHEQNAALLREYMMLVTEKIRSTKKGSPFGDKFDIKKFKALENVHQLNAYAGSFLDKLGQGSSRAAYLFSSRYVLKIAINQKGIAQNETEASTYTNPQTRPMVAKLHGYDPEYKWLIADVVKPLKSESEFKSLSGVEWDTFLSELKSLKSQTADDDVSDFAKKVWATVKSNDLLLGDLAELSHWGKTPDGSVVLLDYGFSGDVWDEHYSQSRPTRPEADGDQKTAVPGKTAASGVRATKAAGQQRDSERTKAG